MQRTVKCELPSCSTASWVAHKFRLDGIKTICVA